MKLRILAIERLEKNYTIFISTVTKMIVLSRHIILHVISKDAKALRSAIFHVSEILLPK